MSKAISQRVDSPLDWKECTLTSRGVVSQRMPMNLQMGLGHKSFNEGLIALASDFHLSESNRRAFHQRWAQLMDAESWADVQRQQSAGPGSLTAIV